MPAFAAINLDPEEIVTEEIDNTKELQVDDALKQFQTALKLHAQGPRFFDEAADAYNALFECDIFKYPESKTEYERAETQTEVLNPLEPTFLSGLDATGADGDNLGTTLLQAYYLSYKNHGQYILDRIKHRARAAPPADRLEVFEAPDVLDSAKKAVEDFTAALDRDPSDAELWRRTARVAAFLKSARINRYALEAAIELDDDPAVTEVDPPSLAEGFAGEQLRSQLDVLSDHMALTHPIMKPFVTKEIPSMLKPYVDPISFLPNPTTRLGPSSLGIEGAGLRRIALDVKSLSWTELGMALLFCIAENGLSGEPVSIHVPVITDDEAAEQMEIDKQLQVAEDTAMQIASTEEVLVQERKASVAEPPTSPKAPRKERSISLPTRKRSQSMAGLPEAQEDEMADNKRSKRVRRRDTAAEENIDPATLLATQLQPYQAADQNLFQTTKNILENLGVTDPVTLGRISEVLETCATEDRTARVTNTATIDLRDCIVAFDEENAKIFLNKKETPQLGISTFHEHTKTGSQRALDPPAFEESQDLRSFVRRVNQEWLTLDDLAYEWVSAICKTYAKFKWSDRTKTTVVHIISRFDKSIYERVNFELQQCDTRQVSEHASELDSLVQTLFELHLDVYERINIPSSTIEHATRMETKGRLDRWFNVAAKVRRAKQGPINDLVLRFVWAAVFTTTFAEGVTRDHILALWHNLRDYLAEVGHADINLPNNIVMPEVSASAADREISKLTTMDFFLGLFQDEIGAPVAVIEMLEPVLNPNSVLVEEAINGATRGEANGDSQDGETGDTLRKPISEIASQGLRDLWKFLENSSTDLRLFLWTRLAGAYATIKYTTKEFSCYLRGIEMIAEDFELEAYINTPSELRRTLFVTMLKAADDLLVHALSLALNDNSAFDIIDEAHIRSTTAALAKLSCILHVAFMFEDEVKIGMSQAPTSSSTFSSFFNKLREMQVRAWSLQYTMFKVGINQNPEVFPKPENDLADYLAAVHQVLGLRKCCKGSNKVFLRMMRIELLKQQNIENWEDYLGQVLYDLYGLKLGVGIWEVQDHGCPPEKLERRAAMGLVEKITTLANRMSIKDLLKSDLRAAIDHMQQAIGSTKSTPQMIHNLRNFTEYMKKPIHPLRLYQAMTGKVSLDAVTVNTPESALARHGWFFLLGMIAFTKFKAVDLNRRQTPGATDDLRIGATFLRLQLQFTPDHWNAWFRLAESFDYEVEEAVLWTADKMNKDREELVKFQRNSIHCYTLALSYSRSWEADSPAAVSSEEDEEVLSEMYYGFGMRLYASSREPFAMEPFQHADQERFFINMDPGQAPGTFRKILHEQMSDYKVWKFAASLFKRAMAGRPKDWKNPYMYSKCLWKMHQQPLEALDHKDRHSQPTVEAVVAALERSVQVVMAQQKPRQDPILEPHYKILSIIHKLVMRRSLGQQEAADILQRQPFAPQQGERVTIDDNDDWETYVIRSLRVLRDKDKSNWQHRLIMRHARILFDPEPSNTGDMNSDLLTEIDHEQDSANLVPAKAAFSVLRENMFTKTMVMNVWKCDAERPGRHHVYTSQYVRYMFRLLSVMNDRTNMEALLRRLRKKGADFYHFNDLWYQCAFTYLTLIRHSYKIPAAADDAFKHLSPEEFDIVAERINEWVTKPESQEHPALGALKDSIELKKLNGGLMKSALIDDLITDCYSHLYTEINSTLPGPDPAKVIEERHKVREAELQANDLKSALTNGLLLPPAEQNKDPTPVGSGRASAEPPEKHEGVTRSRRAAVVRKPDILRKAEQAVSRALEGPPKAAGAIGKTRLGSLSGGKNIAPNRDDAESGASHAGSDDVEMKDGDTGVQSGKCKDADAGNESSSPPGSIHDSADDESDLSDVPPDYEDDAPPSLLFPNLRRSMETGATSTRESEDESSAEEEVEDGENGEEEEEDEGEEEGEETDDDNDEELAAAEEQERFVPTVPHAEGDDEPPVRETHTLKD
ncbi:hypothetical protein BR93DRAFT_933624 [Coniochaeta sp. PMI_546]|nr:hypothetical protein BR93DRAFT_933624 [Coniochaeta sp. PMI_546]